MADYGQIVIRKEASEVLEAPERTLMSLSLLQGGDPRHMWIDRDRITLGTINPQTYKVTGWDADCCGLVLQKEEQGQGLGNPPVPEVPCCTVNNCVGVQRAKQGEGCPACPSRPKEPMDQ